jgi:hypothetical protein
MWSLGKLINGNQRLLELQESINSMGGSSEEAKKDKQDAIKWLEDLKKKTDEYQKLTEDTIPKTTNDYNQLANSIKKVTEEIQKANEETLSNFREKLATDILDDLKKKAEESETDLENKEKKAKDAINDEKEAKAKYWDDRIKALQAQLDALNDTEADEKEKLKKLQAERALWAKETNNVFAKSKLEQLDKDISETQKNIQKSELQKQIDSLNDEKDTDLATYDDKISDLEDYYEKKKTTTKKANDDDLLAKKAYAKADQLITSNDQSAILKILSDKAQNYKDVGTLLGKNFSEAFQEEINKAKSALDSLTGKSTTSSLSSDSSNSTKLESSLSTGVTYSGGSTGAISVERPLTPAEEQELYQKLARFDTGGTVSSSVGSGGGLAIVDPKEKILNKDDSVVLDEIYSYFKDLSNSRLITQLSQGYSNLGTYMIPTTGTELSNLSNNIVNTNSNTNNSSYTPVQMNVNIVNEKGSEAITHQQLEKMMDKVVQKKMTRYGGKSYSK